MTYRCLVVDDESLGRDLIKSYLEYFPNLEIGAECSSAIEAMQLLAKDKFDIMFLDINMPQVSGIELLKQSNQIPLTILCTAYSEYALESYDLDVVDYLLKPIELGRFTKAIGKAMNRLNSKSNSTTVISEEKEQTFFVKSEYKKIKIEPGHVKYIEAMEKYVRIHTTTDRILTLMSMSSILDCLPSEGFMRIHRSYIVNKNKIDAIEGNMVVIGEVKLPISKANRKMVSTILNV